jgi:hypothetical protein
VAPSFRRAPLLALLAVPFALCAAGAAGAATWYVAPGGLDAAAGTIAAPWKSIAHAQAMAHPGDTVYLRGGTYAYTQATAQCASRRGVVSAVRLDKSGLEDQPIRYWAYPGEHPVFDFSAHEVDDCRVKGIEVSGRLVAHQGPGSDGRTAAAAATA